MDSGLFVVYGSLGLRTVFVLLLSTTSSVQSLVSVHLYYLMRELRNYQRTALRLALRKADRPYRWGSMLTEFRKP